MSFSLLNGRRSLAHLSDLHLGHSLKSEGAARALCATLLRQRIDHVVVTGDVTHRGRLSELRQFEEIFAPLIDEGRLSVVPGNHDRVGEDAGRLLLGGKRVVTSIVSDLYLVSIDSTGPHNRSYFASHGSICDQVLCDVDAALDAAPAGMLVLMLLHHHVVPLPEETLAERFSARMGWPNAAELRLGAELLRRAVGRADLVLHGHRHIPRVIELEVSGPRPLTLYNAGSSTELKRMRVFTHCAGALVAPPVWLFCEERPSTPPRSPWAHREFLRARVPFRASGLGQGSV